MTTLNSVLESTPWIDIIGNIFPRTGGGIAPSFTAFKGGNILNYAFSVNDVIDNLTFHIPHEYQLGTDIYLHPHWGHNGTAISGNFEITWYITYMDRDGQYLAEKTLVQTIDTVDLATTPRWDCRVNDIQISESGGSATSLNTDLIQVDGLIQASAKITGIPAITGGSPNEPFIFNTDLHIQSTGIGTKSKDPDYYT